MCTVSMLQKKCRFETDSFGKTGGSTAKAQEPTEILVGLLGRDLEGCNLSLSPEALSEREQIVNGSEPLMLTLEKNDSILRNASISCCRYSNRKRRLSRHQDLGVCGSQGVCHFFDVISRRGT